MVAYRYHERAGIAEHDGGLSRYEAEIQAYCDTFMDFVITHYPNVKAEFDALLSSIIIH